MSMRAIGQLRTPQEFRSYINDLGIELPLDDIREHGSDSPFRQPYTLPDGKVIGNRFCIQPMEGWDGTIDGHPTEFTYRRWRNFGISGAKLIWGGEAVAVCPEGRANPNQLIINRSTMDSLAALRLSMVEAHQARFGSTHDLLVGLQLTHSGRFSRPKQKPEPVILYHHPILDKKVNIPSNYPVAKDDEIASIIEHFVTAAVIAWQIGFDFVDIKHCHGYLGHEFLSAESRKGIFGGSFENRTRFLREIVKGIREQAPGLRLGVRLSVFDMPAFEPDPKTGVGRPVLLENHPFLFGASRDDPLKIDLTEPVKFLELIRSLGINMVNLSAGSPYYNPHIQRPARFPPSDGYLPPEDPLVGVARQMNVCATLKKAFPDLLFVGSAYSYLQEFLENVGQYNIRHNRIDFVGLGRQILSYPEFPADVLAGKNPDRRRLCRTFSDCTTAPRNGMVSGCYPLDPFYKSLPEYKRLEALKRQFSK